MHIDTTHMARGECACLVGVTNLQVEQAEHKTTPTNTTLPAFAPPSAADCLVQWAHMKGMHSSYGKVGECLRSAGTAATAKYACHAVDETMSKDSTRPVGHERKLDPLFGWQHGVHIVLS